ncbi:MAG: hypothetical protein HQK76_03990 [Desulfobacterales bacterium]|nr:hypothetical protein [Desulfobacterales bacterium]
MAAGFKTATVNASDVPATATNFPAYVDLSRLGITTLAEAQSVRVYADSGKTTEWAREIVSETEMHVKVPSLTSTTSMYVDWDGSSSDYSAGDTYGSNAVWSDYSSVYHLESLTADNSGNGLTLTNTGSVTNGTGQLGDGANFTGAAKYLRNTTSLTSAGTSAFTFSLWVDLSTDLGSSVNYGLASADDTTNNIGFWFLYQATAGTNNLIYTRSKYAVSQTDVVQAVNLGTSPRFIAVTFDGSTVRAYLDGSQVNTGASSGNGTSNPATDGIAIGIINRFGPAFYPIGVIDESFLERRKAGDVFVLGGKKYIYRYTRGMNVFVKATVERQPTIPSWFSEQLPLSFDSGLEISRFRKDMSDMMIKGEKRKDILDFIQKDLYVNEETAVTIYNYFYDIGNPFIRRYLFIFFYFSKICKL